MADQPTAHDALPEALVQPKSASPFTVRANEAVQAALPFSDRRSFTDAKRGFIATLDPMTIAHRSGTRDAFDLSQSDFLNAEAPATVNPSLWRQAQLNAQHHGLFEVCDGVYQVRSFDIANMTLIRGDTGWILIDPLTAAESSAAALALANEHLGERPVVAVIHTHSHADHFAGILGVTSPEAVAAGEVQIIAPDHFVQEALSENVLAGNVMNRRATYMYGNLIKPSATGFVGTGLGAALAMGTTGFIVPTDLITTTGERRTIDGVEIVFQMTPGTEAPAEFVFYLPASKALCMSEITSHHLHNVYTPRGAQVRDALAWAAQINESIDLFGSELEVQFASHHWPIWGQAEAVEYLRKQRDLYKYIHDQTIRLANHGYTMDEIAEQVELPDSLGHEFYNRDYYGTLRANTKAVYVKYLGFFDANPATLNPLPRVEAAPRYVAAMGGAEAVLKIASTASDAGEYRWAAELLNHLVFADVGNTDARALLADVYEQLGYQAESGPWRNFYLCGALELRQGLPHGSAQNLAGGIAAQIPMEQLFQALAVRLNGPKAATVKLALNLVFTDLPGAAPEDTGQRWLLQVDNAVLHAFTHREAVDANATLRCSSQTFKGIIAGSANIMALINSGELELTGDPTAFMQLRDLFDQFERRFPIVTPRPLPQ